MQPFPMITQSPARVGFTSDLSAADLSTHLGLVAGNGGITIEFFYNRVRLTDPANPEAHGAYKTVLCVRKRPHGDRYTESVRMISEAAAAQWYPREYAWFKQHQDVPTDGTPLAELPGISQSQIAILVVHNIRCVEDLIRLSPDQIGQIGMDARSAYALAKKWVESKEANGEIIADAARDARVAAELDRLRKTETEQAATIAKLAAQVELLMQRGQPEATVTTSASGAQMVDADDLPDVTDSDLFNGAQAVVGNDDLDDEAPKATLPGLDRRKK